jgi:aspartate/methionine/tyrosine aminotransferase
VVAHLAMKHSPYIAWIRSHAGVRYNLARSGMPPCRLDRLGATLDDLLVQDAHDHGWPRLVEAIAARYGVTPGHVVVTTGATLGNHVAMAALLAPGDEVLVEHPVYEPLALVPRHLQASVVPLPRRAEAGWALRIDDVRERISPRTRLVVLSNLHNPTGALIDDPTLDALASLADEHGFHVLVDEVYLELTAPQRTAASRSPWFLSTRSLTKAFGLDTLRVGWILAEPALAARVRCMHDLFASSVAHPSERLALLALGRAGDMLAPTLALLAHNRARAEAFVAAQPRLSWTPPRAGTVGFVRLDGGAGGAVAVAGAGSVAGSVDALAARLEQEHDTAIAPGRFFGAADHFRIGWSMPAEIFEAGLERLAAALAP